MPRLIEEVLREVFWALLLAGAVGVVIAGMADGQVKKAKPNISPEYHRIEERLAEFDRAARSIGRLEMELIALEKRVEELEEKLR